MSASPAKWQQHGSILCGSISSSRREYSKYIEYSTQARKGEWFSMKIAGGVVSIVFAVVAVISALATLLLGGIGEAVGTEGASLVTGLGWAGLFISFVIIAFAAAAIGAKSTFPAIMVIVLSLINVIAGGTLVAIFMVPALLGGIVSLIGVTQQLKDKQTRL